MGKSELPEGFAERAAQEAIAAAPASASSGSLIDRLLPIAWPTAAASVVCAIAITALLGWQTERAPFEAPLDDPVAQAVELPATLEDPTLALLGEDQ